MTAMSNRLSLHAERRTASNDNGSAKPLAPSGQGESRSDRSDSRQQPSPQPSTTTTHRRNALSSQRTSRGVEERRTERVQVTTRETLTSKTRSPERRPGPSVHPPERPKQSEASRAHSGETQSRSSKAEAPQGMIEYLLIEVVLWP